MRLAFIGGGVMAEAIIAGIRRAGLDADIIVGEPVEARRDQLVQEHKVTATADNLAAISGAGVVVLAVKPQQLPEVAAEVAPALDPAQTVLSIVAGVRLHSLGLKLNHDRLVRVMPNTPAQVGSGMSVWTAAPEVPGETRAFIGAALSAIGSVVYLDDEKLVDMATAISASGPGYVFAFLEALIDGAVLIGMPPQAARTLAVETLLGSAVLARETGKHPAELRNMVTSPGGTTAAGLMALEEGGLRAATINAVRSAYRRSEELGSGPK